MDESVDHEPMETSSNEPENNPVHQSQQPIHEQQQSQQPIYEQQPEQQPEQTQTQPSQSTSQQQQQQQQQQSSSSSQQLPSPLPPMSTSVSSFIQQQQQQQQQQQDSQSSQESGTSRPYDPTSSSSNNDTLHGHPNVTINNILDAIEEFDSSIPDSVVHHFLNISGMQTNDQRIIRLIAIAAQKFIYDIVSDSLQHCKLHGVAGKKTKEKKHTLTIEDLSAALAEYGIEVRRQQYFN